MRHQRGEFGHQWYSHPQGLSECRLCGLFKGCTGAKARCIGADMLIELPTPKGSPDMTDRAREVIESAMNDTLLCALCGAALPNEDCGHRKNGVSPCCIPATHEGADHILAALAAEGIGLYDTATHAAVPREITKAMVRAADACCDADGGDAAIWQAMLTAAEAEAKGGE